MFVRSVISTFSQRTMFYFKIFGFAFCRHGSLGTSSRPMIEMKEVRPEGCLMKPTRKNKKAVQADSFSAAYFLHMIPQAIFSPAFPDGWERKSSARSWITTVLPMISCTQNRSVRTAKNARLPQRISGGRSPV